MPRGGSTINQARSGHQSKTIRLPVHLVDKIAKVRRVSLQMGDELGASDR